MNCSARGAREAKSEQTDRIVDLALDEKAGKYKPKDVCGFYLAKQITVSSKADGGGELRC